jgi:hypothetical protein
MNAQTIGQSRGTNAASDSKGQLGFSLSIPFMHLLNFWWKTSNSFTRTVREIAVFDVKNHSRNQATHPPVVRFAVLFLLAGLFAMRVTQAADLAAPNTPGAISWNAIGAKAGADYKGDGLAVTPTESGALLHCVFQRLDGEATPEGLWLASTVANTVSDCFRVTAVEVGRKAANETLNSQHPECSTQLAGVGNVTIDGQTVRFSRPGLQEEYSVSMDGVRQDFIVEQSPSDAAADELVVKLAVTGAQVERTPDGVRLVLGHSSRKIAYSRLRVTDATGEELPSQIEVLQVEDEAAGFESWNDPGNFLTELTPLMPAATDVKLAVVVNDANAVYPVRIDPTFSDANWVSMGGIPGADYTVSAAVVDGAGNLYIGGEFSVVGNVFANSIAEWNGSTWLALGSGISGEGADVFALAVSGGILYAGGYFTTAGGISANSIAQWNGSNWSALGSGLGGSYAVVDALAVSGSVLYAGGYITTAGGITANNIAQWNGSTWSALGSGMSGDGGEVFALAVSGNTLYAGGYFTTAGGNAANSIAQWNGSSWSALGSGIGGVYTEYVYALAVSGSTLYAGGTFTTVGTDTNANSIAQWNGSNWSALGSGISGGGEAGNFEVNTLAASGGTLYAGGAFTFAGVSAASCIAQWNDSSWSALASGKVGFYSYVDALAVSGSTLYAGGNFTAAGGSAANYIAQWNGSSWSSLGSGMNRDVDALAVSGGMLYAGGGFTTAGSDTNANCIAQWNGTNWSALGSGMGGVSDAYVSALAVSGSSLYAAGYFTTAGGSAANNIAQWNGSSWSALGSGINGDVEALAVAGGTLYAGGAFEFAGGSAANCIAQWNGSSWSALGSGMTAPLSYPQVSALAVSGSTLYAGGLFTLAGGVLANYIAQWNGSSWSALGSGVGGFDPSWVNALAVSGGMLYLGGDFTTAGGNVSYYAAAALLAGLPVSLNIITTNAAFGFTNAVFGFDVSGPVGSNIVVQGSADLQTWIPLQTNMLGSGLVYFSDTQSPGNVGRFYRA